MKKVINIAKKKPYRPMTFERKKYLIYGSREKWLREQKERDKKYKEKLKKQNTIRVKGHYRIINNKRIYIKPYYRKTKKR